MHRLGLSYFKRYFALGVIDYATMERFVLFYFADIFVLILMLFLRVIP